MEIWKKTKHYTNMNSYAGKCDLYARVRKAIKITYQTINLNIVKGEVIGFLGNFIL